MVQDPILPEYTAEQQVRIQEMIKRLEENDVSSARQNASDISVRVLDENENYLLFASSKFAGGFCKSANEDSISICCGEKRTIVSVIDGHAGDFASYFLQRRIHVAFSKMLSDTEKTENYYVPSSYSSDHAMTVLGDGVFVNQPQERTSNALCNALYELNATLYQLVIPVYNWAMQEGIDVRRVFRDVSNNNDLDCGAVMVTAVMEDIEMEDGTIKRTITIAHIGDCFATLYYKKRNEKKLCLMTDDHDFTNASERERIKVECSHPDPWKSNRLFGMLEPCRAFGDYYLADYSMKSLVLFPNDVKKEDVPVLVCKPDLIQFSLIIKDGKCVMEGDTEAEPIYLLLSSDGLNFNEVGAIIKSIEKRVYLDEKKQYGGKYDDCSFCVLDIRPETLHSSIMNQRGGLCDSSIIKFYKE